MIQVVYSATTPVCADHPWRSTRWMASYEGWVCGVCNWGMTERAWGPPCIGLDTLHMMFMGEWALVEDVDPDAGFPQHLGGFK